MVGFKKARTYNHRPLKFNSGDTDNTPVEQSHQVVSHVYCKEEGMLLAQHSQDKYGKNQPTATTTVAMIFHILPHLAVWSFKYSVFINSGGLHPFPSTYTDET